MTNFEFETVINHLINQDISHFFKQEIYNKMDELLKNEATD